MTCENGHRWDLSSPMCQECGDTPMPNLVKWVSPAPIDRSYILHGANRSPPMDRDTLFFIAACLIGIGIWLWSDLVPLQPINDPASLDRFWQALPPTYRGEKQ